MAGRSFFAGLSPSGAVRFFLPRFPEKPRWTRLSDPPGQVPETGTDATLPQSPPLGWTPISYLAGGIGPKKSPQVAEKWGNGGNRQEKFLAKRGTSRPPSGAHQSSPYSPTSPSQGAEKITQAPQRLVPEQRRAGLCAPREKLAGPTETAELAGRLRQARGALGRRLPSFRAEPERPSGRRATGLRRANTGPCPSFNRPARTPGRRPSPQGRPSTQ